MSGLFRALTLPITMTLAGCFPDPASLDAPDAEPVDTDPSPEVDTPDTPPGDCVRDADCAALADTCLTPVCLGGTCATRVDDGGTCDDGDPCTSDDRCDGVRCAATPYLCDDGIACTEDRCDGLGGCTYPVRAGHCLIGGACHDAGEVKADDPCRICEGGQAWSPNDGAPCEDGDPICTIGDTCAGTECVSGTRPSDADTDWVTRPVSAEAPASAGVVGLVAVSDDVLVLSESRGGRCSRTGRPVDRSWAAPYTSPEADPRVSHPTSSRTASRSHASSDRVFTICVKAFWASAIAIGAKARCSS